MLRITRVENGPTGFMLKVEGKIMSEWVRVLHDECQEGSARSNNVVLDLSGVFYVDREGVEMLRAVLGPHVRIAAAPLFLTALLHQGEKS